MSLRTHFALSFLIAERGSDRPGPRLFEDSLATKLRPAMIASAAVAAALTVIVSLVPRAFAYRAPEGHVAIETAASLVSLLIGFILLGRFLQSARLVDLLLAAATAV